MLAAAAGSFASAASLRDRALAPAMGRPAVDRPVHVIVGFAAGGGTDLIARLLADRLRGRYASAVLVENKPGAAARIAVETVKNAEPDGSVILFTPDFPLTVYPHSFRSLSYDPLRDLAAVAPAAKSMLTYNIGPAVPDGVKTLAAFVQWCRDNPGRASYATTAAGGTPHFVGMMMASAAGLAMTPVHYRGGAPALQDLLGGHVPASINPISEALPHAKTGALRMLAVTGAWRSPFLPDIPTMTEAGYRVAVHSWLGVFVPARTPHDVVGALNAAIGEAVKSPDMVEQLAKLGNEPAFETPGQFAAMVRADLERWGPVVKASGFVAQD
jgi:tripartite-type tricarboxylate transporter receptor subunit TctC